MRSVKDDICSWRPPRRSFKIKSSMRIRSLVKAIQLSSSEIPDYQAHMKCFPQALKTACGYPTNFLCVRGEFDALNYTTYTESERWHLHITEGKIHDNSYKQKIWNCGKGDYEEAYPNILYANDGEIFVIEDKAILTIGGACMQNKQWRSDIFGIEFIPDKPQKWSKIKQNSISNSMAGKWTML